MVTGEAGHSGAVSQPQVQAACINQGQQLRQDCGQLRTYDLTLKSLTAGLCRGASGEVQGAAGWAGQWV